MHILAFKIELFKWTLNALQYGGPLLMFALLFLCGLGLPVPEDIPLVLGGFFIVHLNWHPWVVCILAWCGIIGGDCVLYRFGRKYGLNITRVPFIGKHVTAERIQRAEALFERYGIWVVAVGRLFAGIRGAMVVAAGAIRFNFIKFIIADGLAALVSGGLFIGLGYYLGRKFEDPHSVWQKIEHYKGWVMAGIAVAVASLIFYLWWRAKRHKGISDIALEKAEQVVTHAKDKPVATPPSTGAPEI
jgi:membrane protein DedA with SNARE-associated domain